jgi:hypothetical protein
MARWVSQELNPSYACSSKWSGGLGSRRYETRNQKR